MTKQYPWHNNDRHCGDLENVVTDHLLITCPKEILDSLLDQVRKNWKIVLSDDQVRNYLYEAEIPEPHTVKNSLEMALDCLMWKIVTNLLNDYKVRSQFDVLTMTIKRSDLFVLKHPDPENSGKEETFIGIAMELEGRGQGIWFVPRIGPHFDCSWHRGVFTVDHKKGKKQ
jgi:hypothetical protein